jgi:hypothetical protein
VHLDGDGPGGALHLHHSRRADARELLKLEVMRAEDVGHRAVAGPLERPEPHSSTGDAAQRVDRCLAQPGRDPIAVEDLDLVPGTVAQDLGCGEQRGGAVSEPTGCGDRGLRAGADLPAGGGDGRLAIRVLVHRSTACVRHVGTGRMRSPSVLVTLVPCLVDRRFGRERHEIVVRSHERGSDHRPPL